MSEAETKSTYSKTALINAASLGAFAIVAALVLGLIYVGTKDRIEASIVLAEQKALLAVIGDNALDNDLLNDTLTLNTNEQDILNEGESSKIYVVRHKGKTTGFIFPATAPDGYSGDISMIVGVSTEGSLFGVRVIEHKETPGLGDKIDAKKSDWIEDFAGKSLSNPSIERWAVTKDGGDFDAFTGATITPRSTVNRVKSVLEYFEESREALLMRAERQSESSLTELSLATPASGNSE